MTGIENAANILTYLSLHRPFQKVLHRAAYHAGELIGRLCLGLVDIVEPLLAHRFLRSRTHPVVIQAISLQ